MKAPPFLQGKITYESEINPDFAAEVAAIPGGEGIFECLQCGTCSGVCSIAPYMDYTPRRLINMVRAGFKNEVLHSRTVWLCTGCYACAVNCPAGIHITDVMYALKRLAMKNGTHPRRFPIPILVSEFIRHVRHTGRSDEAAVVVRTSFRTNPLRLLRAAPLGLKMLCAGRMRIRGSRIEDPARLVGMLESVSEANR